MRRILNLLIFSMTSAALDQGVCGGKTKAAVVEDGTFVYKDIPLPEPIDRQVLIQVNAAAS